VARNLVGDLHDNILLFALSVLRGDVEQKEAPRAVWFAEVILPSETAQVLWPKGRSELDIDCNRNLGFDEANAVAFKLFCNLLHQFLGEKIELGAKAIGL
jgi:hypothetical protein